MSPRSQTNCCGVDDDQHLGPWKDMSWVVLSLCCRHDSEMGLSHTKKDSMIMKNRPCKKQERNQERNEHDLSSSTVSGSGKNARRNSI